MNAIHPSPAQAQQALPRGLLDQLGNFAHALRLEDAPEVVRRQARLSILDTVGCMVAGLAAEESQRFVAVEAQGQPQDAPGGASTVAGPRRLAPQAAARVNGYLGDVFELNDLTGGHASIAVVPTALALAEAYGAGGRALVEAVIAGIEVTSRVYAAYYDTMKSYEETGIAPPGIPSTIGSAAAAARLVGLDAKQTGDALAIAAALAGWCPAEVIFGHGGTIKPMLFGAWPANVAIQAVAYASAGFDGPVKALESPIGLYATLAHRFDASRIADPGVWYLAQPRRKQHACCGYIHSALDAVIALRRRGVDVGSAATIEVGMPGYIIPGVSKTAPPRAPNEARFHAQYCIALAAQGEHVIRPQHSIGFERYLPQVQGLLERVQVREDSQLSHYHQCRVRGLSAHGQELFELSLKAPKGAPGDPMTDREVVDKFLALCEGGGVPAASLDGYLARIETLEQAKECTWIVREFSDRNKE